MAERPGIMFYFDLEPALSMLEDKEAGTLLKAAMEYGHYGVVPKFDDSMLSMVWTFVKPKIDRDGDAYQRVCIQNAYNRYLGECKKYGTTALSMEVWEVEIYTRKQRASTLVDDGSNPSPTITTTTTPTTTTIPTTTTSSETAGEGAGKGKGKGVRGEGEGRTEGEDNALRNAALEKLDGYLRGLGSGHD